MAPYQIKCDLDYLKKNDIFFSIQTDADASNHKNRKIFPICVQYFTIADGITNKIIDFVENADESAKGMSLMVQNSLEKVNLSIGNITSLSADNTNSNFGKKNEKNSLYTNLKEKNHDIIIIRTYNA